MKYGLPKKDLAEIQKVLGRFPNVERAVLFGVRAAGSYTKNSDVEILVEGENLDWPEAAFFKFYLDEVSQLPYSFDIVDPGRIPKEYLDHIKECGAVIYEKKLRRGRPPKPAMQYLLDRMEARKKRKDLTKYGISKTHLAEIQKVLGRFPKVERAVLFGRRAVGEHLSYTDVEIAIEGKNMDWKYPYSIKFYFEYETSIPHTFDIVGPKRIKSEDLADEIREDGVVIYEKKRRPGRPLKDARNYTLDKIMARRKRRERQKAKQ